MRKFLSGLIIGIMVSTIATAFAVSTIKEAYINPNVKITYNGQQVDTEVITAVKEGDANGSNYVPVRALSEAMGKTVSWDGETQTIRINDKIDTEAKIEKGVSGVSEGRLFERDGLQMLELDGVEYVYWISIKKVHPNISWRYFEFEGGNKLSLYNAPDNSVQDIPIIDSVPISIYNLSLYIEYDYYLNTILPLIQKAE
jgi:hypothetical protein